MLLPVLLLVRTRDACKGTSGACLEEEDEGLGPPHLVRGLLSTPASVKRQYGTHAQELAAGTGEPAVRSKDGSVPA
eukprot:1133454-Pelagomonas_calceolata.AAC.1